VFAVVNSSDFLEFQIEFRRTEDVFHDRLVKHPPLWQFYLEIGSIHE
jgi:hypothetical protein